MTVAADLAAAAEAEIADAIATKGALVLGWADEMDAFYATLPSGLLAAQGVDALRRLLRNYAANVFGATAPDLSDAARLARAKAAVSADGDARVSAMLESFRLLAGLPPMSEIALTDAAVAKAVAITDKRVEGLALSPEEEAARMPLTLLQAGVEAVRLAQAANLAALEALAAQGDYAAVDAFEGTWP